MVMLGSALYLPLQCANTGAVLCGYILTFAHEYATSEVFERTNEGGVNKNITLFVHFGVYFLKQNAYNESAEKSALE